MLLIISESFKKMHSGGGMDYEFLLDITGQVMVRFSMEHEAVGH